MRVSPFAPDFTDLEFETFQIVHVPFLTGWTVGGRAGIPAILILVGFSGRMGFPLNPARLNNHVRLQTGGDATLHYGVISCPKSTIAVE